MKLSSENIEGYYERLVRRAQNALKKRDIESSCFELESASTLAYNFNFRYADIRCDDLCRLIGEHALTAHKIDFTPNHNRLVFYDAFSWDNRGLTQQYIRALMDNRIEFLYIFGGGEGGDQGKDITKELHTYDKVSIVYIDPSVSTTEKIKSIYNAVANYAPGKALLHIAPWSIEVLAAFSQLENVKKYNINLTDHAYWLGSSIVDYNIEFRDYGTTVSIEKRGFAKRQLQMLPYYPITTEKQFQGFPEIAKGKLVLFSGGSVYKVYGESGMFFCIVKRLLNENPNAVLLFAGGGRTKAFEKFIQDNNFKDRIALIGNRSDINEVFKNADIYLGTYPFTGGLMSQYAAVNGIPILAYTDPKFATNYVEGIVCHNENEKITYDNLEDFFRVANELCRNKELRETYGYRLKQCVIHEEQFNTELGYLLKNGITVRIAEQTERVDYKAFESLYIEVENKFQPQMQAYLVSHYRLLALWLFPKLFFKSVGLILNKVVKAIEQRWLAYRRKADLI